MGTLQIVENVFLVLAIMCIVYLVHMANKVTAKTEKDFDAWLLENATKTDQGHYLYRHDKTNRFYSRKELFDFFSQTKKQS